MDYKKEFSQEEIAEVVAWFKAHMSALPQDFDILPGVKTKDLPGVVSKYLELAEHLKENKTFHGQLSHLFVIREKLQQQGID